MDELSWAVDTLTADELAIGAVAEVLDAVGMTAYLVGIDLPTRWIAPSWSTVYGGSREIFAQRPAALVDVVHPDDVPVAQELLDAVALLAVTERPTGMVRRDLRMRLADGSFRWTEVSCNLVRTAGGVRFVFGVLRDASTLHAARTDLLAMAEAEAEANRATAEFVSKMSHELRTPLHAMLGYAQLLEMGVGDPVDQLGRLRRAGDHAVRLLDDLLDFSRLSAGRLVVHDDVVDLPVVVEAALDIVRGLATSHDVELGADLTPGVLVRGDATRLRQVVANLLTNACKYNRAGGSVTVTVRREAGHVVLEVTDTGHGIPPDLLERLFVPFDRLGAEGSEIDGVGLGLPLSHGLVRAMGGRIAVASTSADGTTVRVTLRAADPQHNV
jgi:PAS domain S-box-containing protein